MTTTRINLVAEGELADGTTWEGIRVLPTDFVRLEHAARMQDWGTAETSPMTTNLFLSFSAAYRSGAIDLTWTKFVDEAIHATVVEADKADEPDVTTDFLADPTPL